MGPVILVLQVVESRPKLHRVSKWRSQERSPISLAPGLLATALTVGRGREFSLILLLLLVESVYVASNDILTH